MATLLPFEHVDSRQDMHVRQTVDHVESNDVKLPEGWTRMMVYHDRIDRNMPFAVTRREVWATDDRQTLVGGSVAAGDEDGKLALVKVEEVEECADPFRVYPKGRLQDIVYDLQQPQYFWERLENNEYVECVTFVLEIMVPLFKILEVKSSETIDNTEIVVYHTDSGRNYDSLLLEEENECMGLGRRADGSQFIWRHTGPDTMNVHLFKDEMRCRVWARERM